MDSLARMAPPMNPDIATYPVKSSNIASVGYDPESRTMQVNFLSGTQYHYYGVDQPVYDRFLRSKSLGSYLADNIKDRFASKQI